jgi:small subunit ribosomal protein S19
MVGHKLGEFAPTRKFNRHGGKMQKELEVAAKQRELDAAKAAKAAVSDKK